MSRSKLVTMGACFVAAFAMTTGLRAEPAAKTPAGGDSAASQARLANVSIGAPQTYQNLTIFPVVSNEPCDSDRYITLDEGLASGQVQVTEVGAAVQVPANVQATANANLAQATNLVAAGAHLNVAGDVNRLLITNRSGKPLYLMPGEIIVGGKQDRTLAQATVISNDGEPTAVSVFCVEHGRWHARSADEIVRLATSLSGTVVDAAAADKLSRKAASGEFVASGGTVSKAVRLPVNSGGEQSQVWRDVGSENAKAGNRSQSSAFTENFTTKAVQDKFMPYVQKLEHPVADTSRIVGIVVAINGRIELADVFESTPLFRKLWPKLLKSYALDAATTAAGKSDSKACTADEATAFLHRPQTAKAEKQQRQIGVVVDARKAPGFCSFYACPAAPQNAAADGTTEPPRVIHAALFAK